MQLLNITQIKKKNTLNKIRLVKPFLYDTLNRILQHPLTGLEMSMYVNLMMNNKILLFLKDVVHVIETFRLFEQRLKIQCPQILHHERCEETVVTISKSTP